MIAIAIFLAIKPEIILAQATPPAFDIKGAGNIDPTMGSFSMDWTDFSIGATGSSSEFSFKRYYRSSVVADPAEPDDNWSYRSYRPFGVDQTHSLNIFLLRPVSPRGAVYTLVNGDQSVNFNGYGADYALGGWKLYDDGGNNYRILSKDGDTYYFNNTYCATFGAPGDFHGLDTYSFCINSIVMANGDRKDFNYINGILSEVDTSSGYKIKFNYDTWGGGSFADKHIRSIDFYESNCSPQDGSCQDDVLVGTTSYTYTQVYTQSSGTERQMATSVDFNNGTTNYYYNSNAQLTSFKLPGQGQAPFVNVYYDYILSISPPFYSTRVKSQQVYTGEILNFTYENLNAGYRGNEVVGGVGKTTVTRQDSSTIEYESTNIYYGPTDLLIADVKNELGYRWHYTYKSQTPLVETLTDPQGIVVQYDYDTRGNVTKVTTSPKAGSPLSAYNEQTKYADSCNSTNFRTCNRPVYKIDKNSHRTNYSWDTLSGLQTAESGGRDASGNCLLAGGVCPSTTKQILALSGFLGQTFYVTSSSSTLTGSGHMDVGYTYDNAAGFNPKEMTVSDGSVTYRTCYSYDSFGNKISETTPNANLASCQ
jgi:hypothetical protein